MDTLKTHNRKRSRLPGANLASNKDDAEASDAQEFARRSKRTQKKKQSEKDHGMSASASAQRSGRAQSLGTTSSSQQVSEGQPKERSRKHHKTSRSSDHGNESARSPKEANTKQKRPGRPRKSRGSPVSVRGANAIPGSVEQQRQKGLQQNGGQESSGEAAADETDMQHDAGAVQSYRRLVAQTRLIALKAMTSKWVPLEQEALAAIQNVLADCARPVLSHLGSAKGSNSERRQEQSRIAISATTRRLRSKLTKGIPFPVAARHSGRAAKASRRSGGSREPYFDFEQTLECMKALEQQLDPLQHSVMLLEGHRRREERTLEADYAALRQLEINAQAETRTWRDRTRRSHVLAPADDKPVQVGIEMSEGPGNDWKSDVYQDMDKGLSALSAQLGNHMESLRSNLQQIQDVVPAIAQSKAALEQVLHSHLNDQQFERIALGDWY